MVMGGISFLKNRTFLLAILTLLYSFPLNYVVANDYTVGDQEGWSSQTNYVSWAERYNFSVGDVLVFKYLRAQHNVYEVSEETYRSCDASSGVLAKYESGEDQVALNEVKKYWFICNIEGHCLGGMRFGIEVKNGNNIASTNSPDGGLNTPIGPAPSDNSCMSYFSERWRLIENFIPFGLLLFNLYFW